MWIRALGGHVVEVDGRYVAELVEQGHQAFETEAEARGVKPVTPKATKRTADK